MGQIFSNLTKQGVVDPASGQANFDQPDPGTLAAAKPLAIGTPPVLNPQTIHPSVQQAASLGATPGGANALSPALTKGGKLATLLMSGLQGALAGRAKSEETVAATGGRRSGGAGMGFEAGYTLPWQRAQELAQTQVAQAGAQPISTPYGNLPAALAPKLLGPYLGYEKGIDVQRMKGNTAEDIQGQKSQTAQNVANTAGQYKVQAAGTQKRFMATPTGLFDTQSQQVIPGTARGFTVTPDIAQQEGLPQEAIGQFMTMGNFASLQGSQARNVATVMGAGGPALVTKSGPNAGKTTNLGLGVPALGGIQEVGDPNNPGETTFTTKSQAIRSGASGPQSASVQVPRTAAKAEVPTKIGDQKVAFTTMIQHADLLRRAAKALNNGDMQSLSGLENAFKNEFGYSGPITSAAIADAYKGEVSNVINKGHITDTGNEKIAHTLDPTKQNYETIDSVLGAYQSLAQSKMNMLNKQKQSAIDQSQPKRNQANAPQNNAPVRTIVF